MAFTEKAHSIRSVAHLYRAGHSCGALVRLLMTDVRELCVEAFVESLGGRETDTRVAMEEKTRLGSPVVNMKSCGSRLHAEVNYTA